MESVMKQQLTVKKYVDVMSWMNVSFEKETEPRKKLKRALPQ